MTNIFRFCLIYPVLSHNVWSFNFFFLHIDAKNNNIVGHSVMFRPGPTSFRVWVLNSSTGFEETYWK